ncbi:MAG: CvpA family protein [Desulfovibrionaceae bacterium]|nr:CvpA family protein [Desulfovibrionaceae bacterium]
MLQVNILDIGTVLLLAVFSIRGLIRGLVREIVGLAGLVLAFFIAGNFQANIQPYVAQLYDSPEWTGIIAYVFVFLSVLLCVALLAAILHKFLAVSFTHWLDHLLGAVIAFAKGVLIAAVIFYLLHRFLPKAPALVNSDCAPYFTTVIDYLHNFLPAAFRYP